MVGYGEIETEQADDGSDQTFGLPPPCCMDQLWVCWGRVEAVPPNAAAAGQRCIREASVSNEVGGPQPHIAGSYPLHRPRRTGPNTVPPYASAGA